MLTRREGQALQISNVDSQFEPATGYDVIAYEPGAFVNGAQSGVNTVTVHPGHKFAVNDYVINFDAGTTAAARENTLRQVTAVAADGTTITFNGATLDFTDLDRIVNLGSGETGIAGSVNYDGSDEEIWTDPDGVNAITNSKVTVDATTAEYEYFFHGEVWEVILNTDDDPTALNIVSDRAVFRRAIADAAYTATPSDDLIAYTSLTTGRTVTLPAVATVPEGFELTIKDEAGGAGTDNITVDGNGAETIDGAATVVIAVNYGQVTVYSNGSAWFTKERRIA